MHPDPARPWPRTPAAPPVRLDARLVRRPALVALGVPTAAAGIALVALMLASPDVFREIDGFEHRDLDRRGPFVAPAVFAALLLVGGAALVALGATRHLVVRDLGTGARLPRLDRLWLDAPSPSAVRDDLRSADPRTVLRHRRPVARGDDRLVLLDHPPSGALVAVLRSIAESAPGGRAAIVVPPPGAHLLRHELARLAADERAASRAERRGTA